MRKTWLLYGAMPFLALAGASLVGCGGDEDTVAPPTPNVVSFEPDPGAYTLAPLETVELRVRRNDGTELSAIFSIQDQMVGEGATYTFSADALGVTEVRASVQVNGELFEATWVFTVSDEGLAQTPPVLGVHVESGAVPGSLTAWWNAPAAGLIVVELKEYDVAWSLEPITEENFEQQERHTIAHRTDAILQRIELEGLLERQVYHVRVRVRDVLDRVSTLSETGFGESTGHFDVGGTVYGIRPLEPMSGMPNVLIDVGGYKTVSKNDGQFLLPNLPDLHPLAISVQEASGESFYAMKTTPLLPETRSFEFVLFPRGIVNIQSTRPGDPDWMEFVDYLRLMTANDSYPPYEFVRWERYPVRVFAPDFVNSDGVAFRLAFRRGIEVWNETAGDELFVLTDDPTEYDVRYSFDVGGILLGQAVIVLPEGGVLYEDIPSLMEIRLRQSLRTQVLTDRIVSHELGHVLGLAHSIHELDLMYNAVNERSPEHPTREEAFVARLLRYLPQRQDASWYVIPE